MSKQNKRISEEINEDRLQEHKDAIQLAEWRKKLHCKAVCDYLDKHLLGWREEPKFDDDDDDSDEDEDEDDYEPSAELVDYLDKELLEGLKRLKHTN